MPRRDVEVLIRCICRIKHLKLATSRPTACNSDEAARYLEIAVIAYYAAVKVAVRTAPNDISAMSSFEIL